MSFLVWNQRWSVPKVPSASENSELYLQKREKVYMYDSILPVDEIILVSLSNPRLKGTKMGDPMAPADKSCPYMYYNHRFSDTSYQKP